MSDQGTLEIWRAIPGFEELYEVSNIGRVRSLRHVTHRMNRIRPVPLVKKLRNSTSGGYSIVTLNRNRIEKNYFVHVLVLMAFVGPRPSGYQTRHLDGNPKNNTVGNLVWGTHEENERDRVAHGRIPRGERQARAKLTAEQVRQIRQRHVDGGTWRGIAREFGTTAWNVKQIVRNETWKHVA